MTKIQELQDTVHQKEMEIQRLLQQIAAAENQQREVPQMSLEIADMKIRIIAMEEEVSDLRGAVKLSQEEATCYQEAEEHTTALLRTTPTKVSTHSYCLFAFT